jgi:hypothetical protein
MAVRRRLFARSVQRRTVAAGVVGDAARATAMPLFARSA